MTAPVGPRASVAAPRVWHVRHEDFAGECVRVLACDVGAGVGGSPAGLGPRVALEEDGRDIVADTMLIRDVAWDGGSAEVAALVIGKSCGREVEQMVALAQEKMATLDCAMVRIARVSNGWQISGLRTVGVGIGS